jgi:hypothetical protein
LLLKQSRIVIGAKTQTVITQNQNKSEKKITATFAIIDLLTFEYGLLLRHVSTSSDGKLSGMAAGPCIRGAYLPFRLTRMIIGVE